MDTRLDDGVAALRAGRAFVRPRARTLGVRGADAERWLDDLVTAGLAELAHGASARSLILTPTGRIRADLHVLRTGDGFILVQPLDQPESARDILSPYVLSSDVRLVQIDASAVLLPADDGWRASLEPPASHVEVDEAAGERWRIEAAIARFPVDLDSESLPAEAGLDVPPVTDTRKGCFLGQESVARVRNLGHPTRLVVPLLARRAVRHGEAVTIEGREVGVVTSVAEGAGAAIAVLARIRWDARNEALRTAGGAELVPR